MLLLLILNRETWKRSVVIDCCCKTPSDVCCSISTLGLSPPTIILVWGFLWLMGHQQKGFRQKLVKNLHVGAYSLWLLCRTLWLFCEDSWDSLLDDKLLYEAGKTAQLTLSGTTKYVNRGILGYSQRLARLEGRTALLTQREITHICCLSIYIIWAIC